MTSAQAAAVARATARARQDRLTVLAGTWRDGGARAFAVHSTSEPRYYLLKVEGGRIRCECTGSRYGNVCKHAGAVRMFLANEQASQAAQELAAWYRDFLRDNYPAPGWAV